MSISNRHGNETARAGVACGIEAGQRTLPLLPVGDLLRAGQHTDHACAAISFVASTSGPLPETLLFSRTLPFKLQQPMQAPPPTHRALALGKSFSGTQPGAPFRQIHSVIAQYRDKWGIW